MEEKNNMKPSLLVLAAGMGSRYGSLKQIDPVGPSGETIIDYSVYDALRAGFGKIVFVIRKNIEKDFKETLLKKFEKFTQVDYVFQELDMLPAGFVPPGERKKPWGTAHAVLVAENAVKTPFAVINADDFYGYDAFYQTARFLEENQEGTEYSMIGYLLKNTLSRHGTVSRGVCKTDSNGYLVSVTEHTRIKKEGDEIVCNGEDQKKVLPADTPVSMNFWGFTPSVFGQIKQGFSAFLTENICDEKSEYFIPEVVDKLIKTKKAKVRVLPCNSSWFGVTYREDKPAAIEHIRKLVERGEYPDPLWK